MLAPPFYYNLLLGSLGTLNATPLNLALLVSALPSGATWAATGIGRFQFPINALAVTMGGHVRVGLEDALYMDACNAISPQIHGSWNVSYTWHTLLGENKQHIRNPPTDRIACGRMSAMPVVDALSSSVQRPKRVLLLIEGPGNGGDFAASMQSGLEAHGCQVITHNGVVDWPDRIDMVIGYGPFTLTEGNLLPARCEARHVSQHPPTILRLVAH